MKKNALFLFQWLGRFNTTLESEEVINEDSQQEFATEGQTTSINGQQSPNYESPSTNTIYSEDMDQGYSDISDSLDPMLPSSHVDVNDDGSEKCEEPIEETNGDMNLS